jgi:hypothetical protein
VLYPGITNALLVSDEAYFHLTGYVNKHSSWYWAADSPCELCPFPLHSLKVTVWCAVSSCGIIGPYFFDDDVECVVTLSAEWYEITLENFLADELHNRDLPVWFDKMEPLPTVHG